MSTKTFFLIFFFAWPSGTGGVLLDDDGDGGEESEGEDGEAAVAGSV
jgi:hypothetical protein